LQVTSIWGMRFSRRWKCELWFSWVQTPYNFVGVCQRFWGTCRLHL
jgi:hypothetical protein